MTLKDLMLQQQAEDAKEVYNNRVFLGIEKKEDRNLKKKVRNDQRENNHLKINYSTSANSEANPKIDKIQSRSLPKTPDYAQSFKPDDVDIIMIRSKEGQTLRNFGYEFISEEDPEEAANKAERIRTHAAARRTDKVSPTTSWSKKKGINWINSDKNYNEEAGRSGGGGGRSGGGGSFKKLRTGGKLENIKTSSEKIFSFKTFNENSKDSGVPKKTPNSPSHLMTSPLKPVSGYSPMTLPLNKKSTHFFNIDVIGSKKSNGEYKENNAVNHPGGHQRKLSVPERSTSYFTKLNFVSTKTPKEKKIFGSPRLHRAIFGKQQSTHNSGNQSPGFDEISLSTASASADSRRDSISEVVTPTKAAPPLPQALLTDYPPVFKPETYSFSDPSASSRRSNNRNV